MAKNNNGYVTITIPRDRVNKDNDTMAVSVNGKMYLIKRGVPVSVPDFVEEVIRHSYEAEDYADDYLQMIHNREGARDA